MAELELTLRPNAPTDDPVSAWYLPGDAPEAWLTEITAWEVAQLTLRIAMIPRSFACPDVAGILVIPDVTGIAASGRCVPFQSRAGGRMYIPAGTSLRPPLSDAELNAVLADDRIYVWHPSGTLVAVDEADLLTIGDLVTGPRNRAVDWDHAIPGVAHSDRLASLRGIETVDDVTQFLQSGRGDIGDAGNALDELPPSPGEPKSGVVRDAARKLGERAARTLAAIARGIPGRGDPAAPNRLAEWAHAQVERIRESINASRQNELLRLMHMLENDPDEGLRYAPPLAGEHRGIGNPSDALQQHPVDFDLRHLGGGQPGVPWEVSHEMHWRLQQKYRELANRELSLGRFRRAAYIFAALLDDPSAAASALKSGSHFREAARLYRDKLQQPLAAAECLELGGLLAEAIDEYRGLGMHEKVGDLHARLGQADQAEQAYQQAIVDLRRDGECLSAARVADEKLNATTLAAEILVEAWPGSDQAEACVTAAFELYARRALHDDARDLAAALVGGEPSRHARVASLLAKVTNNYPDPGVRREVGEHVIRVIACRLPRSTTSDVDALVAARKRLAPADKLLERDGERFIAARAEKRSRQHAQTGKLHLVSTAELGDNTVWHTAVGFRDALFAAGTFELGICVARIPLSHSAAQTRMIPFPRESVADRLLLIPPSETDPTLGVYVTGASLPRIRRSFQSNDVIPYATDAGPLAGTHVVFGGVRAPHGFITLKQHHGFLVLEYRNHLGGLVESRTLARGFSSVLANPIPVPMHATSDRVCVGLYRELHVFTKSGKTDVVFLGMPIVGICGASLYPDADVALALQSCVAVLPAGSNRPEVVARDLVSPKLAYNRGGYLIVGSDRDLQIYRGKRNWSQLYTETHLPASVVSIVATRRTDQFAVLDARGTVSVYGLGRST